MSLSKKEPFSYTSTKRLLQMYQTLKKVINLGEPTKEQEDKFEEVKALLELRGVKLP